ncbi:hypothetical protein [Desulfovermiculus halophilus]|jgi:hypothetical protein|uniref:hypothetical protein n=1 Tax=Desulfovermiculus halophilus TaxID=339722 RepID=UPI000484B4EC|nr:hypothetical protein [Desulfovermiculus halophilus]
MNNSFLPVRIVPKEDAVFWLDKDGCWRNRHGKFHHPKIIARFHACIRKDEHGFYLTQDHPDFREKVYFPYEDTALFVFDVQEKDQNVILKLNTGQDVPLPPDKLSIHNDHLYMDLDGDRVKFSERALVTLSKYMQFDEERGRTWLNYQERSRIIPDYQDQRC